jgi:hypothetical protein
MLPSGSKRARSRISQRRISLLFSDRRKHSNLAVSDFENGLVQIAATVSNFNAMQSLDRDLIHLVGNRVIAVSSQAVDTGPD